MPSETEYFIISVPLPWFKVGGLRAPCGARPRGKYSSVLGSPCCCLPPVLKCQSPSDKCTKQFWVPTATTSPSLLDPPWQGELPGGSLARWLSPLAAAQGDLTESVPALPNCWRNDSIAFDPAHPCRTPTPPITHAIMPRALPARCLAHSSCLLAQNGQSCRESGLQVMFKKTKKDDDIVC